MIRIALCCSVLCVVMFVTGLSAAAVGQFEGQTDIGDIRVPGSATFDPDKKEYKITGIRKPVSEKPIGLIEIHFIQKGVRPGSGSVMILCRGHLNGILKSGFRPRAPVFYIPLQTILQREKSG